MGRQRKMVCTIVLAVINIVVFFVLSFGGMTEDASYLLERGAMYVPNFVINKEYYRIFTCMFLHFGFEHLMNNMLSLVIMGSYLEPIVGKIKFLVIYLLAGLGGNVFSLAGELLAGDYAVSAGASGAIFGLTGALLCLTILNRGRIAGLTRQGMMIMIGISLYNGFVSDGVDNIAHVGGLLCGFVVTLLICFKRYTKRRTYFS